MYADSTKTITLANGTIIPFNTNMFTTPEFQNANQVRAGFCLACHNGPFERRGDNPALREVAELSGTGADFVPEQIRPLRDYHLVDAAGNQVLPATIGGDPPPGSGPSLGAAGITCDMCHNLAGPISAEVCKPTASPTISILFNHTIEKVGPFSQPVAVKDNFHVCQQRSQRRSHSCARARFATPATTFEFRWPLPAILQHAEHDINPGGQDVTYLPA